MKRFFAAFIFLAVAAAGVLLAIARFRRAGPVTAVSDCGTAETRQVRGISMQPLLISGEMVSILMGYYKCHSVQRGDLIAYHYAGDSEAPLVKQVYAIPGDQWKLQQAASGTLLIIVNGRVLRTAAGDRYEIPAAKAGELRLYAKSYPTIPSGAFLLFGEIPGGSMDSTEFGLAGQEDILGKVVEPASPVIAAKDFSIPGAADRYIDASPGGWTCTISSSSVSNGRGYVQANCTGSQKVISGGCSVPVGDTVTASEPVNQGWFCADANNAAFSAFANCCQ